MNYSAIHETEYVARMDADDICEPHRLEKQMAFLGENRDVVMLGTGIDFVVGNRIINGFRPLTRHSEIRQRLLQRRSRSQSPDLGGETRRLGRSGRISLRGRR